jgi:D-sedoheptulose 7-phosphate isomerase|tara:strand:+ start:479 stop:1069 length:591 start_codon:yes stop_codon:yes gene_type:complete
MIKTKKNDLNVEIKSAITYLDNILKLKKEILLAEKLILKTFKNKKKILICGNGGSAAQAQHLAAEFLIRLNSTVNRKPLPVIPLAIDSSTMTACLNDYSSEIIFSRILDGIGQAGDLLIAISTSGNSKNIISAIKKANDKKINVLSILGNTGGKQKKYSNINIIIPGNNTARIQEAQLFVGHFIFNQVEKEMFKKN